MRSLDALKLKVNGYSPVLGDGNGVGQSLDDPNDGWEDDVTLDHGFEDGLYTDLDQFTSGGRQVDKTFFFSSHNLKSKNKLVDDIILNF